MVQSSASADVIVVGAGLAGSCAARELTLGGLKTILLDAGPVLPSSMFLASPSPEYLFDLSYHLFRLKLILKGDWQNAFSRFIAARTSELYLDRRKYPYSTQPGQDFSWTRVRAVGGRGNLWGRVMLRYTDRELSKPGCEWPISYSDLEPYYAEIERILEMGGAPSQNPDVPDGEYVHARYLNTVERKFTEAIMRRYANRVAVVNHVAQYEPSPMSPMLSAADETGNLQLIPNKLVTKLTSGSTTGEINEVVALNVVDGSVEKYTAPFVVLAASAFESVCILLRSKSSMFPNGLGNRNGLLGTRILEHVVTTFTAQLPKKERSKHPIHTHNPFKLNAEPHGFYLPPFNICKKGRSEQSNGYGIQGTISPDTGLFYLGAFGETTCFDSNRIRLSETLKDRYGLAAPEIEFSWSSNDMSIYKEMVEAISDLVEVFEDDCGIKLERPMLTRIHKELTSIGFPLPGSNHECGGARMGNDPKSSVVDPFNRLWDAPNIIVCDAACFPSIPHQNPTLTTMAIATRAARALHSSKHISTQVRV